MRSRVPLARASPLALLLAAVAVGVVSGQAVTTIANQASYDAFAAEHPLFLVLVYAPWCGHSKALHPVYEDAAKQLAGKVPLAKVDGTVAEEVATHLDVKGYPTIFAVQSLMADEYDGQRTAKSIVDWAQRRASPDLKQLASADEIAQWRKGKDAAAVLFLTAVDPQLPSYKAMVAMAGVLKVPCAVTAVPTADALAGAPAAPILVVFKTFDDGAAIMEAPATRKEMQRFVKQESLPWVVPYTEGREDDIFGGEHGLQVLLLHAAPVTPEVTKALEAAAQQLRGKALFTTVDVSSSGSTTRNADLAEYFDVTPSGLLAAPVVFALALDRSAKYQHEGPIETGPIAAFALEVLAGSRAPYIRSQPEPVQAGPVVTLVGSSFERIVLDQSKDVFVNFYAPDCGHCRKLQPVYSALAEKLAGDTELVIAQIDALANDAPGIEPEGFPTLIFYPRGNKKGVEYDGSRDAFDMEQFIDDVRHGRQHVGGLPELEAIEDEREL